MSACSAGNLNTLLTELFRFDEIGEVYRVVAEDTELGMEQPGRRHRGTSVESMVEEMRAGMLLKRAKVQEGNSTS